MRTQVGYAGGSLPEPDYHHLGDHTEAVEIVYDPERISYVELLGVFWSSHDPSWPSGRQYRSVIWVHDEEQRSFAQASLAAQQASRGKIYTAIEPAGTFWTAEGYHQKFYLRSQPALLAELEAIYPEEAAFVGSTAVARVNGWLGGHADAAQIDREIGQMGLSPAAQDALKALVSD